MKKTLLLLLFVIVIQQAFSQWNSNPAVNNIVSNAVGGEVAPVSVTDGAGGSIIVFANDENIYAQKITSTGSIAWGTTANPVVICNATNEQTYHNVIADGSGGAYITWTDYRGDPEAGDIYIQHINSGGTVLWAANGTRVTPTGSDDYSSVLCSDGSGGVIVAWSWDNLSNNQQVSVQRYNSAGTAQWASNGVQVSTAPGFRVGNSIVSDGESGAIVIFLDTRDDPNGTDYDYIKENDPENVNIYAQRINGTGGRLWTNNGVVVCAAAGNQYWYGGVNNIAFSDGNGGAIICFDDERNGPPDEDGESTNIDIYAQKLNSSGSAQWGTNGVPLTMAAGNQYFQSAVSDGAGGVVAAWISEVNDHVYSQKLNSAGTANWAVNGILISPAASQSYDARMVADEAGNYIYSFTDFASLELLAQKVNSAGALQWGTNSAIVSSNIASSSSNSSMVLSDNGGVIISWADYRGPTTGYDIFASKILSTGVLAGNVATGFITNANGNWNSPATWVGGVVPPATAQVTVKHNVTVTANASCYSLTVDPSVNLVVATGVTLTVTN